MLHAVTALEGLLPLLPSESIHEHIVKPRQVLVHSAVLAEAPSLSAAAGGGPTQETQPSLLVDMLLNPLHHPFSTPQLRNRLAALLMQVNCCPVLLSESSIWLSVVNMRLSVDTCSSRTTTPLQTPSRKGWLPF